jgi:negative regulator of genetic competence, sporulation and motility
MNIEVISCTTVKATLTKEDLKDFELSYKLLDQNSLNTQMLLLYIIDEIKIREGIDLSEQKIYIEIFPIKDSGCLFYFSAIDESNLKKEEQDDIEQISVFSSDIDKIKAMSAHLYLKPNNDSIINSELYYSEKYFYIIISIFVKGASALKA